MAEAGVGLVLTPPQPRATRVSPAAPGPAGGAARLEWGEKPAFFG